MKKIICICLLGVSLSAVAEVVQMDENNPDKNQLIIDKTGLYRYRGGQDFYHSDCDDIYSELAKKKCLEAEKAVWERNKTPEELAKEGSLFTGKIQVRTKNGKYAYFYVNDGKKEQEIPLILDHYYFEKDILYSIKTEMPVSENIVIGGVEGLPFKGKKTRFIARQRYKNGLPSGNPVLAPADKDK